MNEKRTNSNLIVKAEKEISLILKKLEKDTVSLVESVSVQDIEITTFSDIEPEYQRQVLIEIRRSPGSNW